MNQDVSNNSKLTKIEIIQSIKESFNAQSASLNARLKSIKISDTEEQKVRNQYARSVLKDRLLGLVQGEIYLKAYLIGIKKLIERLKNSKRSIF